MQSAAQDLPTDIAELQAMVSARDADLRVRDLMIEKLKHQLAGMRRHRFGASSETLDQLQLTLEDGEVGQAAEAAAGADREPPSDPEAKGQPKRKPLPAHLPRNEEVLSPDSACGHCGGKLKKLGDDVTEELEYLPGRFVVNRIVRPRMACSCCETMHQAALPSRPIERGRPGPGLLAHVLKGRAIFADDTPVNMLAPGSVVSVLIRQEGRTPPRTSGKLHGLHACGRLCGVQRPLPRRQSDGSGLHGPYPAQVRRCAQITGFGCR